MLCRFDLFGELEVWGASRVVSQKPLAASRQQVWLPAGITLAADFIASTIGDQVKDYMRAQSWKISLYHG